MAKELILMTDVDGLGDEGEMVRVAEGYARNFLLPRKLAAAVTPATRRLVEKKRAERIAREAATRQEAQDLAAKLADMTLTLKAKAGEGGQMYGSISAADLLTALEAQQGIKLSRKQLQLASPIREVGEIDVPLKLHPDVTASIKVVISAE
jgi:large subunit ribosomal protein L9